VVFVIADRRSEVYLPVVDTDQQVKDRLTDRLLVLLASSLIAIVFFEGFMELDAESEMLAVLAGGVAHDHLVVVQAWAGFEHG